MIWVLYDVDVRRAKDLSVLLMAHCGIQAFPFQEAQHLLGDSKISTTLLVHCDAVRNEFDQIARIKQTSRLVLRFYCTDLKDRMSEVALLPQELKKLIS